MFRNGHDHPFAPERQNAIVPPPAAGGQYGDVDRASGELAEQSLLGAVDQQKVCIYDLTAEVRKRLPQIAGRKRRANPYSQWPTSAIASRFEREEEAVRLVDDGPRRIQKFATDRRELRSTRRALEQVHAERAFEIVQSTAEGGLTRVQRLRRLSKASMPRGDKSPFQISKFWTHFSCPISSTIL
jgi:predicted transcriptional regulator